VVLGNLETSARVWGCRVSRFTEAFGGGVLKSAISRLPRLMVSLEGASRDHSSEMETEVQRGLERSLKGVRSQGLGRV
jgi:hypothetical protein